jgi:hypothetical protein
MSEISPSIWQQNEKGDWKLYFNTDMELNTSSSNNIEQIKIKNNNISAKNLILGTLVMTPKGIGRLIKSNDNIGILRFKEDIKEEQFPLNKISNNFNCFIYDYTDGINIIRLNLKVLGKIDDIFLELEKLKKINRNEFNYTLVYNGKSLQNEYPFEQLNILNNAKFLLLKANNIKLTLSRFLNVSQYWYTYSVDGICFSSSQKIKLIGIGLYGSHENKIINSTIKILDGPSINSKIIYEENIDISPGISKIYAVSQIFFSKPIICKQNQDYSVILYSKTLTNCYYGQQGKQLIEGEKGVNFTFKRVLGKSSGSGVESGNFPEFYYCIIL